MSETQHSESTPGADAESRPASTMQTSSAEQANEAYTGQSQTDDAPETPTGSVEATPGAEGAGDTPSDDAANGEAAETNDATGTDAENQAPSEEDSEDGSENGDGKDSETDGTTPTEGTETKTEETQAAGENESAAPPAETSAAAPAFDESPAETAAKPIELPADPDGSIMVGITRDSIRNLVANARVESVHKLALDVSKNTELHKPIAAVQTRILQHANRHSITEETLGDVLQGAESERFEQNGLPATQLLALFQHLTPVVIEGLARHSESAA